MTEKERKETNKLLQVAFLQAKIELIYTKHQILLAFQPKINNIYLVNDRMENEKLLFSEKKITDLGKQLEAFWQGLELKTKGSV